MLKLLYILIALTPTLSSAQNILVINGEAPLFKDGTEISLQRIAPKRLSNLYKTKTTQIKDRHFKFTLNVDGAELYYMSAKGHGKRLFLEPGKANVTIADSSLREVTVGSNQIALVSSNQIALVSSNQIALDYESYDARLDSVSLFTEYGRARVAYDVYSHSKNLDSILALRKMRVRDSLLEQLNKQLLSIRLKWIKSNPTSQINANVLYDLLELMPEVELKNIFYSMPASITNNTWGKELKYRIDSLFVGGTAPDFSQPDTSGRPITLASFKGKYVFLDFWASWCLPCRAENPDIVKIMQKFAHKNFAILGISLDRKKDAWLNGIKQDGLHWTQLSDQRGWENPVSVNYYVHYIPSNYLIDPEGRIIAKNLHGNELMATLDGLFK